MILYLKMAQRNEVILVGRIGKNMKFAMSQSGNEYVYFMLEVENQTHQGEWDNEYYQTLHIMCFKRNVIKYLKDVCARTGNIVIVFGYASSYLNEIKGKSMLQNSINATEVFVVKTKKDK